MASIPAGVVYASLEDQFFASSKQLLDLQMDIVKNPNSILMLTDFSYDSETESLTITANIPCVSTINATGEMVINAKESFL